MMKNLNMQITLLSLILFSSFQVSAQTGETIIDDAQLKHWGYRTTQNYKYDQRYCDQGEHQYSAYQQARVVSQAIRKINSIDRMELIREVYPDKELAKGRVAFLQLKGPHNTKYEKRCSLRKYFVKGNTVYIVYTDMVSVWWNELPDVFSKIEQYINLDNP